MNILVLISKMKRSLVLTLVLISFMQSFAFSVLTDNKNNNVTQLDVSGLDSENVDVFRQLLNQETLIRMALVKNVHALMKDMVDLKQIMKTLEATQQKTDLEVTNLQQEVDSMKRENQKLDLENRKCEDTLNTVKQNFTQINDHFQEFVLQLEEKRETFERNTSTVLSDLKVEVRYLSITLLDLNRHTLEVDKGIPEIIEEKYEMLSSRLNDTMARLSSDLVLADSKVSKSVSDLKHSQNSIITSSFDEVNKTIVDLKAELRQSQYDQLKLSSTVSALEVFRMNMTSNKCDLSRKVAFTASVSSSSGSWNSGTLVFPVVITNVGNGYNPSNGIFTAPTNGNYVFFVNVQSNAAQIIYADIVLNGSTKVRTMGYNGSYAAGLNLVVLDLQKGDTVWVKHYSGKGYYTDGSITTFSGFLI
ncbi:uncharacterized protein LOC125675853 [Ostrea edulis]|uniref:uncharacterized protein LOC125675853 n=1 Tax=Ostrea edulis TaxID=37623 RepID=UPI0024AFECBA|nr:uncharacterized protein LOC125675853 [Ostrea edulis]